MLGVPVEFLSDDLAGAFGRFPLEVGQVTWERFCWFSDSDLGLIRNRRGDHNRVGFALQLATVRLVGRFLTDPLDVPWPFVVFVADQLGISDASIVKRYGERRQTQDEHTGTICDSYGYVEFSDPAALALLKSFLGARAWTSTEGPTRLFERATLWLREQETVTNWGRFGFGPFLRQVAERSTSELPNPDNSRCRPAAVACWFHRVMSWSRCPSRTRVRIWSRWWAPVGVQRICCFLTMRFAMTLFTVASAAAEEIGSPARCRSA